MTIQVHKRVIHKNIPAGTSEDENTEPSPEQDIHRSKKTSHPTDNYIAPPWSIMHQATTDQKSSFNHNRALKCVVLLAAIRTGSALKLTPVHHPSRKLLLDQESKSITQAFNEAKDLISSEANPSSESSVTYLTQNRVIKRLHTSIERWSLIEDRLRSAVSTSDQVLPRHTHLNIKIRPTNFLTIFPRSRSACLMRPSASLPRAEFYLANYSGARMTTTPPFESWNHRVPFCGITMLTKSVSTTT